MHNTFGALTSLTSLQAIAAMQGAANLSSAGGIAALGGNVDFVNSLNRQASLGGLGGLGINTSELADLTLQFVGLCSIVYYSSDWKPSFYGRLNFMPAAVYVNLPAPHLCILVANAMAHLLLSGIFSVCC